MNYQPTEKIYAYTIVGGFIGAMIGWKTALCGMAFGTMIGMKYEKR